MTNDNDNDNADRAERLKVSQMGGAADIRAREQAAALVAASGPNYLRGRRLGRTDTSVVDRECQCGCCDLA